MNLIKSIFFSVIFTCVLKTKAQWSETGVASSLPLHAGAAINVVHVTNTGLVLAGGSFRNDSNNVYVAAWNGATWKELGGDNILQANNSIYTITSDQSGNVYIGGLFTEGSDYVVGHWNGTAWGILGNKPFNGYIKHMVTDASGILYAAGAFKNDSNQYYVAKWDGASWTELGTGADALNPNGELKCLAADNNGNVYAAGFFTNSSGKYYVAKWNGSSWSEVGSLNANNYINDIVLDSNGNLYAAGGFTAPNGIQNIAFWNGSAWSSPGNLNPNNYIFDLAADASGSVFAAGSFTNVSNKPYVAKWSGNDWTEVGAPNGLNANDDILSVAVGNAGTIYAAGYFKNASNYYYVAEYIPQASSINKQLNRYTGIHLFPNPTTDLVTAISPESSVELTVMDLYGRVVLQSNIDNDKTVTISTQNLASGYYTLTTKDTNALVTGTQKFYRQ